jgi:hypothetical protein
LDGSGAEPAGPSNSSWNRKLPVCAPGAGAAGAGTKGVALAWGVGTAAAIAPIPNVNMALRRFISGNKYWTLAGPDGAR